MNKMKKRISTGFIFPLLTLILMVLVLDRQIKEIPPAGKLFNPYIGVVQSEDNSMSDRTLGFAGSNFNVLFDNREVPHVFTSNASDMYFAQGYVTASQRLWQMDFTSYASVGRLSEVLGEDFLTYDRMQRRMGMMISSKETLEKMESDPETKEALDNYTAGVNAYIDELSYRTIPVEYKLLDYYPEAWSNLKTVAIMKYMSSTLSGYEEDASSTYMRAVLGDEHFKKLYPDFAYHNDSTGEFVVDNLLDSLPYAQEIDYSFIESSSIINPSEYNPRLGSNCWVIAPEKSATGNPILCNDPHLNLTLPSIWFEIQLSSDQSNTYGYAIPGVPGIIIGFNEHVAWGLTNGATDVKDWYKLKLKEDYKEYYLDDKWQPTKVNVEEIAIRGKDSFFDTIYRTDFGPVVMDNTFDLTPEVTNMSLRWTLHDASNEILTFIKLNKAQNYSDFIDAIQHYSCPVQNFHYADRNGEIAMIHQGKVFRKEIGEGKFIQDGTWSENLHSFIDNDALPQQKNPEEGYLYSANNNPFSNFSNGYVNGYYSDLRSSKIKSLLAQNKKFSIEDMKEMQLDNTNRLAELALPILLKEIKGSNDEILTKLQNWNYTYNTDSELALFFEKWWNEIAYLTWDELYVYSGLLHVPDNVVLLDFLENYPTDKYFDNLSTSDVENASDIIQTSFYNIREDFNDQEMVSWQDTNKIYLVHPSQIPALSKLDIKSDGHPEALNATSGNWGPSMRIIVELGDTPKAYGIYAGTQNGTPLSNTLDTRIADWKQGKYYELKYFKNESSYPEAVINKWTSK